MALLIVCLLIKEMNISVNKKGKADEKHCKKI